MTGCDMVVFQLIISRHNNLLTNSTVTQGIILTYRYTLAILQAESLWNVTDFCIYSNITNIVFQSKWWEMEHFSVIIT
jgi:hypothetical protein